MSGASFGPGRGSISSWGWRGDRRLFRLALPGMEDETIEYLSCHVDPVEAWLEFCERYYVYVEGFEEYAVRFGCG